MTISSTLIFHIGAGSVGLLSGAAALLLPKGSRTHRTAGNVFFVSMLGMAASGAYIAHSKAAMPSFLGGVFTFYLVATAWMTVRRKAGEKTGLFEAGALLGALALAAAYLITGLEATTGSSVKDIFPAEIYFLWAAIVAFAAAMDLRMILRGGISGAQRIVRHLWRMCFALSIAAVSFFLGQMKVFPEPLREVHILSIPVIAVLLLTIYWLVRVSFTKWRNFPEQSVRSVG